MRFFQIRLPFLLALLLLSCPLASRADQTSPDQASANQPAPDQTATAQSDGDQVYFIQASPNQYQTAQPTIAYVDSQPVSSTDPNQPADPTGGTAVTPEPSSMVLLATGFLFGGLLWSHQRS